MKINRHASKRKRQDIRLQKEEAGIAPGLSVSMKLFMR